MSGLNRKMQRAQAAAARQAGGPAAEQALPDIVAMGAEMVRNALKVLDAIINDPAATAATRLRAIAMLLERVYGRPRAAPKPAAPVQTVNLVSTAPHLTRDEWVAKYGAKPESAG